MYGKKIDFTSYQRAKNEKSGETHDVCPLGSFFKFVLHDVSRVRSAKEIEF